MHDGSMLVLKKLEQDYDPTDRMEALNMLAETCCGGILVTGLIYLSEEQPPLNEVENLVSTPLARLTQDQMRPSEESLLELMQSFR